MKAQRIVQSVGRPARRLPESRDGSLDVHGSHFLGLPFELRSGEHRRRALVWL